MSGALPAALPALPPLGLAALSAAVLLLLLDHRRANLGARAALWFGLCSCGYGLIRSLSINALSEAHLGGAPYRLTAPLLTVAGVPLQELLGWTVAAGLASYFADRLLRRLGQQTDPYRTALLAGLGLASVCLAVETAAVAGGWWSWSLAHSRSGLIQFPGIALVDWAFVAIDFVLPFEFWRRKAPLRVRLLSLLLFPIHLLGHALTARFPGPIPISGFDIVHVGLIAAVIAAASTVASRERSEWPTVRAEEQRLWPLLATLILLGTTSTQLLLLDRPLLLWTTLPLLGLALFVASFRKEPRPRQPRGVELSRSRAAALFVALLVIGLALRLPVAFRDREFERLVREAAAQLVTKQADAASGSLERALKLRPNHSEALWLLGWAEMQRGDHTAARRHLEAALTVRPDSQEAARLLALLDQDEKK